MKIACLAHCSCLVVERQIRIDDNTEALNEPATLTDVNVLGPSSLGDAELDDFTLRGVKRNAVVTQSVV